ncbi:uncharacterized protein LOC142317532 [Lycorma delicatula]|uniref:uncharacterized protein LOC142317532 n=1 Tax=Lycorma delicatula TaxID=130591 RepID=UPI003F50E76D
MTKQLDNTTFCEWEASNRSNEISTLAELIHFLEQKCQVLEAMEDRNIVKRSQIMPSFVHGRFKSSNKNKNLSANYVSSLNKCALCEKFYPIYSCEKFLSLSASAREKEVKRLKLCFNCLSSKHRNTECTSSCCKTSGKKHNTLLHFPQSQILGKVKMPGNHSSGDIQGGEATNDKVQPTTVAHWISNQANIAVLLSTAVVGVVDKRGAPHLYRVLLDSGSQSNFISEKLSSDIDLLIGAEQFFNLLCDERIKPTGTALVFQNTVFGWILSGKIKANQVAGAAVCCNLSVEERVDKQLQQFWKVEEIHHTVNSSRSNAEIECENHFVRTVSHGADGKFVVSLPIETPEKLGNSRETAVCRLKALERRFNHNVELRKNIVNS